MDHGHDGESMHAAPRVSCCARLFGRGRGRSPHGRCYTQQVLGCPRAHACRLHGHRALQAPPRPQHPHQQQEPALAS